MICSTTGKKQFDKKGARTMANKTEELHHIKQREYYCQYCNYWHLTTVKTNSKKKFRHSKEIQ